MQRAGSLLLAACLVGALFCGCRERTAAENDDRITIAVSITPQAWLAAQLVATETKIITLVRPGESPATYQPTDAQVSGVMKAAVYFRIGVPFESGPWFEAIQRSEKVKVVDVRRGITLRAMEEHHEETGAGAAEDNRNDRGHGVDPHIWLSPRLLIVQARTMAETLIELDAKNAAAYRQRLAELERKLGALDETIRRTLAPIKGKTFFIFHPAWGYFADDYGLRQVAIEIEGKKPTDRELTALQRLAREESIHVVFVQPQISASAADAIAQAIGGRIETIDPLAPDVDGNLLRVAEALLDSYR